MTLKGTANVAFTREGVDADKFEITSAGVLTFADPAAQDFENPADDNKDNKYEVTVVATATVGGTESKVLGKRAVTVTVTNGADPGTVTLSQLQSYLGAPVTAVLNDKDGGVSGTTWQWYRTTDGTSAIPSTATLTVAIDADGNVTVTGGTNEVEIPGAAAKSSTYTPVAADEHQILLAVAVYTDAVSGSTKVMASEPMSEAVSARPSTNAAPKFNDQDPETPGTQNEQASRSVDENKANENVGDPVEAGDGQPLLYTLGGPDAGSFKLESRTSGQIKTVGELDFETKNSYTVTLTATDPLGASATITVNISVNDKNDPAVISDSASTSVDYAENGTGPVATFAASDQDGDAIEWSLTGADAEDFSIDGGVLAFKKSPNFEIPA